ncbi:TIGR02117 family protein [Flavobacterium alkalisoli]|uniref:TIGR02117 family protein n=1 Tax=Flavobacterium alkalisoli TaxID=2602769 RepID=A0A5B9G085_9FLAO|nr:TIGR02117 family protein [Flavobacterium alkalisoli]QEE50477.1 TIGR02117 family protein [Flavobacterium alkalisoli]
MSKTLKGIFKIIKKFIIGLLCFIAVYIIATLVLSYIPVNTDAEKGDIVVYVNSNGVHTDIIVPVKNDVKDWTGQILYSETKANDTLAKYVAFGWGDKGFYLNTPKWSDLKASTAFRAAFYMGTSAMHTRFYKTVNQDDDCVKLTITKEDYRKLVDYIERSFQYDENGEVIWIANRSYGQYDAFYEGEGKYNLFYTCNTWTNCALKAANQKACLWTTYDKAILNKYK